MQLKKEPTRWFPKKRSNYFMDGIYDVTTLTGTQYTIVSGFLSTSTSTNGPPLVFVMQARRIDPAVFRATINTVFSLVNIVAVVMFVAAGKVNTHNLNGVLVAVPALFITLRIGYYFRKRITPERFRYLVIFLMFLSAGSVILSAFTN